MDKDLRIPLNERRLLSIEDFQKYSGLGRNTAINLAKEIGCYIRVRKRFLIDRPRFDSWCEQQ